MASYLAGVAKKVPEKCNTDTGIVDPKLLTRDGAVRGLSVSLSQ